MTPRDALAGFLAAARHVGDRLGAAGTRVAVAALPDGRYEVTVATPDVEFVARGASWHAAARDVAVAMREHLREQPAPDDGAVSAVAGLIHGIAPGGVVH